MWPVEWEKTLARHPSIRQKTNIQNISGSFGSLESTENAEWEWQPNPNSSLKRQRSMCWKGSPGQFMTPTLGTHSLPHTHLHAYTQASVNKHICNMHTHKNPGNICKIQNKDGKLLRKSSDVDLWPLHIQARPHTYVGTQLFKHIHIPHTIKK